MTLKCQIVGKSIPDRLEDSEPSLEEFRKHGGFRNVGFKLGVHVSPTSYLTAPPRSNLKEQGVNYTMRAGRASTRFLLAGTR